MWGDVGGVEVVEAGDLSGKSHNIQEEKVVNVGMRERVEDVKKVGNAIISVMTVKQLDTLSRNPKPEEVGELVG